MILYFVRHGLAEDRAAWDSADDHLRPLTKAGIDKMRASARTMRKLGVAPDVILTSPLTRARQTADLVAEELKVKVVEYAGLAPGFNQHNLPDLVAAYTNAGALLLVGHEPDFSITVEGLIGGGRLVVKKGSLIRVDLTALDPLRGELVWLIPPKALGG